MNNGRQEICRRFDGVRHISPALFSWVFILYSLYPRPHTPYPIPHPSPCVSKRIFVPNGRVKSACGALTKEPPARIMAFGNRDIMDLDMLQIRAEIIRTTRAFFDDKNYLELDTPLLSADLIPESCLEVFKTEYMTPANSARNKNKEFYLVPSPEIWMKKIIADKQIDVYQIGKCFRNCESTGQTHNPEFTMLEYYTMNADYIDSLALTEELFSFLLQNKSLSQYQNDKDIKELSPPFIRLTMEDAFIQCAGFSLINALETSTLKERAKELGINFPPGITDADIYNLVFIHCVEPNLPKEKPVALIDYPAIVSCLAQLNTGKNKAALTRQRWELYVRGLETANCYSEETDPLNVKNFFIEEEKLKNQSAEVKHNIDDNYWKIFAPHKDASGVEKPFPRCSGVALGMDRLIMALTGRQTIDAVTP
jgi:lysyl-tRNA synthetase class 2